ncbi:sigma-54-dependent transcriptional regulator [Tropicimonas sp.]|uniref:sigma-54-dependent transcriptional regulator n=1 Tax=Tropicimonas sp. TaxID=2067044 RepID=UPI003A8429E5
MAETLPTILLVDDEEHSLHAMRMALEDDFDCVTALSADEAEQRMQEHYVQVVFCDQRMPGRTGVEFLTELRDRWPDTVRIIITGYTETGDMIAAINEAGIYQFLTKPWHPDQLLMAARNATDLFRLNRDHRQMALEMRHLSRRMESRLEDQRRALREGLGFENILRGPNSPMNAAIAQARQFATFDVPVLIVGEHGTGKGAMARAIHYASLRSDRPFYQINCAGVDDDCLAADLFGARRGVFPDHTSARFGLLQKAGRGTVFLNGIADLSPRMQQALLRLAEDGVFRPLGGHETVSSDIRLLAGISDEPRSAVAQGKLRPDLYHALARCELGLPPLRARREDIALLAERALFESSQKHGKPVHGLAEDAIAFLSAYDWPGNMRELENEILRMLIFSQDAVLGPELISRHILQAAPVPEDDTIGAQTLLTADLTLKERVETVEIRILRETLTRLKWNKSRAAEELGLSRVGLRSKIDRYGIAEPSHRQVHQTEEE